MSLLALSDIHVFYGADEVLRGVTFSVEKKERIGLIGRNGAGKTTLLRVVTGEIEPDLGERHVMRFVKLGYIAQNRTIDENLTVWQVAKSAFEHLDALAAKIENLEQQIAELGETVDSKTLEDYDQARHSFTLQNGYQADTDIRRILIGLQFRPDQFEQPAKSLSGGQRTRLYLARLLLLQPDLLILDEPTNYLDMATTAWLETYLTGFQGALLVVSHDRYFLDAVTETTMELEDGKALRFPGSYSTYITLREELNRQQEEAYIRQQEEIVKLEDFIARNLVRASTTKRAQSRRKVLEKMERVQAPKDELRSVLTFDFTIQPGKEVLTGKSFSIHVANRTLFTPIDFKVYRGEHIALIGDNGVGKTTFLKAILGQVNYEGTLQSTTHVQFGYFAQENPTPDPSLTVLEALWSRYPDRSETDIRTRLGHVLFTGEEVYRHVSSLSGGERSRLTLALLSMAKANVLLLDEPTNHLDLTTKEILENALVDFEGTILFVSHDRYFINRIATSVWELTPGGLCTYEGNYDDFVLAQKSETKDNKATLDADPSSKTQNEASRQLRKQQKTLQKQRKDRFLAIENEINDYEAKKLELETLLNDPSTYDDPKLAHSLSDQLAVLEEKLLALYDHWSILANQIEEDALST